MSLPAWTAVADALGIGTGMRGSGMRLLDVACGSGEFGRMAADRGATVAGVDAAAEMIELARGLLPAADLRVGTLERLPWADDCFDVVTGFNAFQLAADLTAALAEARRVCRPGGRVVICNWGPIDDCDLIGVVHAVEHLQPGPPLVPRRGMGEPGVLEQLTVAAGLAPRQAALVDVPYAPPDRDTMIRGLLSAGNVAPAVEHSGVGEVSAAVVSAAAPFRRPDGSYLFRNTFRYLISTNEPPERAAS